MYLRIYAPYMCERFEIADVTVLALLGGAAQGCGSRFLVFGCLGYEAGGRCRIRARALFGLVGFLELFADRE